MSESIVLEDGKYTIIRNKGKLTALRYGEEWRDLTGDKMVGVMLDEIIQLRQQLEAIKSMSVTEACIEIASVGEYIGQVEKQLEAGRGEEIDCPVCKGSEIRGEQRGVRCLACNGSGTQPTVVAEPDWTNSKTNNESWKNPLLPMNKRLEIADGAVSFRDEVIYNLRKQQQSQR